jgi:hypothetical protein
MTAWLKEETDLCKHHLVVLLTLHYLSMLTLACHHFCCPLHSVRKATTSSALVTSLFPKSIAERLMQEQEAKDDNQKSFMSANKRIRSFLSEGQSKVGQEPIADLFPNASCFFADIAGFTAWSKLTSAGFLITVAHPTDLNTVPYL